jgi:hypothetical protein
MCSSDLPALDEFHGIWFNGILCFTELYEEEPIDLLWVDRVVSAPYRNSFRKKKFLYDLKLLPVIFVVQLFETSYQFSHVSASEEFLPVYSETFVGRQTVHTLEEIVNLLDFLYSARPGLPTPQSISCPSSQSDGFAHLLAID